jgi:hypothetical protein
MPEPSIEMIGYEAKRKQGEKKEQLG